MSNHHALWIAHDALGMRGQPILLRSSFEDKKNFLVVILWLTFKYGRRRCDLRGTVNWPSIEATVQSGQMEIVLTKGLHDVILLCFDFHALLSRLGEEKKKRSGGPPLIGN